MTTAKPNNKGLTLIEILVATLVLGVVSIGLFGLFSFTLKIINENRGRTGAVALAEQRLEMIRNLPYSDVGTIGGIPQGTVAGSENVIRNNFNYTVNAYIYYIDDPFDGLIGEPEETLNTDYKKVQVAAAWTSGFGQRSVVLSTIVAPKGIETTAGGGTLKINVFDALGDPVSAANVHVENDQVDPVISADYQTGENGILILPGAPESIENYSVTVTKAGYSVDQTCPQEIGEPNPICPVDIENSNPTKPHLTVLEGQLTEEGFSIDLTGTLNIYTINKGLADGWQISDEELADDKTIVALSIDSNDNLYFAWQDYRHGSAAKLYGQKYSILKTKMWAEDVTISTPNNQVYPELVNDASGSLYVIWGDDRGGNQDCYIMKYDTDGQTAWTGDKKINTDAQNEDQIQPTIDFNTNHAYVAWADYRNDHFDIYAQKIDPDGNYQWTPEIRLTTLASGQYDPFVSVDNAGNAFIVWTDEQNDDGDIYAQKIDPDGNKLWTEDLKINTDTTVQDQSAPDIAINGYDSIFYVWTDARNGDNDIFAQKINIDGVAQWEGDQRMNTDLGSADQKNPRVVAYGAGNIVVAWEDNRDGPYTIYAATFSGPGAITSIADVPLHIYGSKKIGDDPIILKYDEESSTDFNGILNLTDMEWDSYYIVPQESSGYTLVESEPTQPAALEPNTSQDVVLTLE